MRLVDVEPFLIQKTEQLLTWRKRRRIIKKAKHKRKNQILDWVQALLWAAVVVLIINQYLLQAYAVPSASMLETIQLEDRLFVDKIVYGPELVPGFGKLPGLAPARRGDIIVFINPDYRKEMGRDVSGIEELFSRLVYMLTLTLVNLDRTPTGEVAKHYLVKRLIVLPGEQMRMRDGRVEVKAAADNAWLPEEDLKHQYQPLNYTLEKKFYPYEKYDLIKRNIIGQTYLQAGVAPDPLPAGIDVAYAKAVFFPVAQVNTLSLTDMSDETFQINYFRYFLSSYGLPVYKENWDAGKCRIEYQKLMLKYFGARDLNLSQLADADVADHYMKLILAYNRVSPARINAMSKTEIEAAFKTAAIKYIYTGVPGTDEYFEDYWHYRARWSVAPYESGARHLYERRAMGWYIPTDRFFPMGDNRDNSRDARWFGAVKMSSLLGKTLFRFWPLNRLGPIN